MIISCHRFLLRVISRSFPIIIMYTEKMRHCVNAMRHVVGSSE